MKKKLIIILSILLVLCVIGGVVIFFVWQSASKTIDNIQNQLGVSPTVEASQSDTSATDGSASSNEACNLLTLDIAKAILGSDAVLASQNTGNCSYTSTSSDFSSVGGLTIVVTTTDAVTAKSEFEQAKTLSYSNQTEAVTGLNADEAYFAPTYMQLSILKGNSWIILTGFSDKFTSEKDLAIAAAKLVLK